MGRLFGTDGIRGVANTELTPELALALGRAVVTVLREEGVSRPALLVGRDPRWSGDLLEGALTAGIASAGGDAVAVGDVPTPGVAYLTSTSDFAAGAMISASHNPVGDNGIKLFGRDGFKLSDEEEHRLEELLDAMRHDGGGPRPVGTSVGRVMHDQTLTAGYVEHLVSAVDGDLRGLRLVVDGANGAASQIAPLVYRRLGASVHAMNCEPDGANINAAAGSTHPDVVARAVTEQGADIGLSHDGDADRVIAATQDGDLVDGDAILAILATARKRTGTLPGNTVVTTVMTNLGFKHAMAEHDIEVVETKVGDRYVLEEMRRRDLLLGGEQSGHIIQLDAATTGDGLLTAVRLLSVMRDTGTPLAALAQVMTRLPQVLVNVRVDDKSRLDDADEVWAAVEKQEAVLDGDGRVLVRPSGTEPVVRVMVEAPTAKTAQDVADQLGEVVAGALRTS